MNFIVKYKLWKVRKKMTPSRQFKSNLKNRLLADQAVVWYKIGLVRWGMVGTISFIFLLSMGAGVYAYVNPEVVEGNWLYPVKQKIEKIEETTKYTPEAKVKFLEKKIKKQEIEKTILEKRNMSPKNIQKKIDTTKQQLKEIKQILKIKKDRNNN